MGANESVRPTHVVPEQVADNSHRRVEAGPEAVVVGAFIDQFAQTTPNFPKQIHCMSNTTII